MLGLICAEVKNFFTYDCDKHIGNFEIKDGVITPSFDFKTNYIRIIGSRKNDGVYSVTDLADPTKNPLVDEGEFHGGIWEMSVPKDFLNLVNDISDWQAKYGNINSEAMSPFSSESFGGYSYTKSAGGSNDGSGGFPNWKNVFASRLNVFRKI